MRARSCGRRARSAPKDAGRSVAEREEDKPGIVVVDPDVRSRNQVESLEQALDLPVFAVDPSEFDPAGSEEIQRAAVFILCWDLGFRCGADLLEEIRSHDTLKDRKVLISLDAPTRNLVRLVMELGADGVCHRPYDEAELTACLERAGITAAAASA